MAASARVLTVCTGNICRSPFLERVLQAELDRSWGAGVVEVTSAGTGAMTGYPMEEQARVLLEAHGYAADGFTARDLTSSMVADADLVLTATRAHRARVASLHPRAVRYVFTFREFAHLVAGLAESGPHRHAGPASAREHLARVVALAAGQRGMAPALRDAEADIVDPYRRPQRVFDEMAGQITAALPAVASALARPELAPPSEPAPPSAPPASP